MKKVVFIFIILLFVFSCSTPPAIPHSISVLEPETETEPKLEPIPIVKSSTPIPIETRTFEELGFNTLERQAASLNIPAEDLALLLPPNSTITLNQSPALIALQLIENFLDLNFRIKHDLTIDPFFLETLRVNRPDIYTIFMVYTRLMPTYGILQPSSIVPANIPTDTDPISFRASGGPRAYSSLLNLPEDVILELMGSFFGFAADYDRHLESPHSMASHILASYVIQELKILLGQVVIDPNDTSMTLWASNRPAPRYSERGIEAFRRAAEVYQYFPFKENL